MMPDLLPTGLRYLSAVLPLAQAVKIIRSVAYFDGADTLAPALILLVWAAIALLVVGIAWDKQNRPAIPGQDQVAAVLSSPSGSNGSSEEVATAKTH